jgi:hypothetical protein
MDDPLPLATSNSAIEQAYNGCVVQGKFIRSSARLRLNASSKEVFSPPTPHWPPGRSFRGNCLFSRLTPQRHMSLEAPQLSSGQVFQPRSRKWMADLARKLGRLKLIKGH